MIENTFLEERYQLAVERIREIPEELSGEQVLKDKSASETDIRIAQARLRRALVRESTASHITK